MNIINNNNKNKKSRIVKIKNVSEINYFNINLLSNFVSSNGLIISRKRLNFVIKKKLYMKAVRMIKTARIIYLLPFVVK